MNLLFCMLHRNEAPFVATFPLQFAHMHAQANHRPLQCDVRWRTTTHTAHQYCAPAALVNLLFTACPAPSSSWPQWFLAPHPTPFPTFTPPQRTADIAPMLQMSQNRQKNHKFRQISQTFSKYSTTLYCNRPQNPSHIFGRFAATPPTVCHTPQTPADLTPARLSNAAAGFNKFPSDCIAHFFSPSFVRATASSFLWHLLSWRAQFTPKLV